MIVLQACLLFLKTEAAGPRNEPQFWIPRVITVLLIVIVALLWAVKNRFTDYP